MGLGTVLASDPRTVTLQFAGSGETRTYARQGAPLTRAAFAPGDTIRSHEGWSLQIDTVREQAGLLTYTGTRADGHTVELEESQLDSHLQMNRPAERLFTGQIDSGKWFELRYQTLLHVNRLARFDLRGLTGGRTSLIPHQLYIAREVAARHAPRVLLADEVGLGKTIEAGLILHQQLLTERARRVLIVVPENLLHQWLVEMLRRFNLPFSLFDEERCLAIAESSGQENPFHAEQRVLCALEFLAGQPQRVQQALAGDWDLLVVDEAHHLQWSPQQVSHEYRLIEQLAAATRGVLLLTATPEQLGKAGHFARLRLLDPDRFPDFDRFIREEQHYEPIARAVETLLHNTLPDAATRKTLHDTLAEGDNQRLLDILLDANSSEPALAAARGELVEHLLDRHGTGRILFRNTRASVTGFPERALDTSPLPLPEVYAQCLAAFQTTGVPDPQWLLSPELLYQHAADSARPHWTQIDPRIDWLGTQLGRLRPARVLVITAHAGTALDVAKALGNRVGIHAAVFHEGMSLVERDRAAAYFADPEYGTRVLVCSEIGSEGRNFQFAHHLVLFDLPLNPDLLEQRIGRLDRIGQTETIRIHVPYLENSAQAVMVRWYHEGLSAFEHTCPAGHTVFVEVESELLETLHQIDVGLEDLAALIATTRQHLLALNATLQRGRDRLLEYNSCRPHSATAIRERILQEDADDRLLGYLGRICDCYDLEMEEHHAGSHLLRPGNHMPIDSFPGLHNEGMTITFDRAVALANEDIHFMTWEHPLVTGALDRVLGNELGNTALTAATCPGAEPGTLLLECLYIMDVMAIEILQAGRYLPPATIRVVVDQDGSEQTDQFAHEAINATRKDVAVDTAGRIVSHYAPRLRQMVTAAETLAMRQMPDLVATAQQQIQRTLGGEINRLRALRRINPSVRNAEIRFLERQREALTAALDATQLHLDALRVVAVT